MKFISSCMHRTAWHIGIIIISTNTAHCAAPYRNARGVHAQPTYFHADQAGSCAMRTRHATADAGNALHVASIASNALSPFQPRSPCSPCVYCVRLLAENARVLQPEPPKTQLVLDCGSLSYYGYCCVTFNQLHH